MTNKEIIKNVLKMLMYRKLLEKKDVKQILSEINLKENIFLIKTEKNNYMIYILDEKIQTINKNINILNYLKNNLNNNKIIICEDYEKKTIEQISEYKNVEIFKKDYFLLELLEHKLQPKYEFVDEKEIESLNIKKNQFPCMESVDPVARYLNLKPGDIIKIIEYNKNSVYNINYRRVYNVPIARLFEKEIY